MRISFVNQIHLSAIDRTHMKILQRYLYYIGNISFAKAKLWKKLSSISLVLPLVGDLDTSERALEF